MNRNDLLQKCVDRGVADEATVEAVSHLFYVYLLSALQRGQRVEVPNFGTFGTRMVGVKRARRLPFFEADRELADRVNERFRQLRSLVIGRFDLTPVLAEEEYKGTDIPPDVMGEGLGKEALIDTHKEVPIEEYELATQKAKVSLSKEKELMPKLNLKDEEMGPEGRPPEQGSEEEQVVMRPPTLREMPSERRFSPIAQVVAALLVIAGIIFALNHFNIIHLWGKKAPVVSEGLEPPGESAEAQAPQQEPTEGVSETAPTPFVEGAVPETGQPPRTEGTPVPGAIGGPTTRTQAARPPVVRPSLTGPPEGKGVYTVQVSSWLSRAKADLQAAKFVQEGYPAFVEVGEVDGTTWHRVRIGRYATTREASEVVGRLREAYADGFWVAKLQSY